MGGFDGQAEEDHDEIRQEIRGLRDGPSPGHHEHHNDEIRVLTGH